MFLFKLETGRGKLKLNRAQSGIEQEQTKSIEKSSHSHARCLGSEGQCAVKCNYEHDYESEYFKKEKKGVCFSILIFFQFAISNLNLNDNINININIKIYNVQYAIRKAQRGL